jgi:hypothetical protein
LIYDVCRVELQKMEKPALAQQAQADYEQRLSDLRYFLVKSNSMSVVQHAVPRFRTIRPPWYR